MATFRAACAPAGAARPTARTRGGRRLTGVMVSRHAGEEHMADEEQLRVLRQGPKAWNEWRQEAGEETHIDLSGANINGQADLSKANLREASLQSAQLDSAILCSANL